MRIEKKRESEGMREGGTGRNGRVRRHLLNTLTHTSIPLWKVPLMEGNGESKLPTLVLLYFILKKNLHS